MEQRCGVPRVAREEEKKGLAVKLLHKSPVNFVHFKNIQTKNIIIPCDNIFMHPAGFTLLTAAPTPHRHICIYLFLIYIRVHL